LVALKIDVLSINVNVAWLQEKKPDGRVKSRIGLVNPKVGIPKMLFI
jgi:hypothetical protein